jgi:phosphoenolpyruvate carboxylase
MADYPVDQLSFKCGKNVLPLLTIQQYGLTKVRELDEQQVQSPMKAAMKSSLCVVHDY